MTLLGRRALGSPDPAEHRYSSRQGFRWMLGVATDHEAGVGPAPGAGRRLAGLALREDDAAGLAEALEARRARARRLARRIESAPSWSGRARGGIGRRGRPERGPDRHLSWRKGTSAGGRSHQEERESEPQEARMQGGDRCELRRMGGHSAEPIRRAQSTLARTARTLNLRLATVPATPVEWLRNRSVSLLLSNPATMRCHRAGPPAPACWGSRSPSADVEVGPSA